MTARSPQPSYTSNSIHSMSPSSGVEHADYAPDAPLANRNTYSSGGSPQALSRNSSTASNYYTHYQQQQPESQPASYEDDETLSNTLANAHLGSPHAQYSQSPNRQPKFTEEWDASVRGSSIVDGLTMQRSNSISSRPEVLDTKHPTDGTGSTNGSISLSRGNTLKKKASLRRSGSLRRSSSRRSMKAGSVRSLALQSTHDSDEGHSVFYCPVPTSGNPTDTLANRFQAWRKLLKDLIAYYREIQSHYEHRSKSLLKLANVANNISTPPGFLQSGGLNDALGILRQYHKESIMNANKAREIEEDVVLALTGLRSDLNQKIKEIKSLSGDFKNSVEKEMDGTRKAVNALQETLGQTDLDSALTTGKQDPYLLRLAVDRQVERQIDEENYLHQAYLNLESSGRELESIVVGEIQKSYNAYASILKRESDAASNAIGDLRAGPVAMPKDHEWYSFISADHQFVDPEIPVRSPENIHYPGQDHYACQEIRAGLLERKSKYLKSYTAGWYVLSPTHLHEFKSADKTGAPVMSLYLPEQKLGSHSAEGGSSNKFILKGRQTGAMHRGHSWVFRAESHDTMMAWYEDIKTLTEKSPEEVSNFVQRHSRSYSRSSQRSMSSDGIMDDEDEEPFNPNANAAAVNARPGSRTESIQNRPEPGGRFPSDIKVNAQRGLQVPRSPSSASSGFVDHNDASHAQYSMQGANANVNHNAGTSSLDGGEYDPAVAAAGALPGSGVGDNNYAGNRGSQHMIGQSYGNTASTPNMNAAPSHAAMVHHEAREDGVNPYNGEPSNDAPIPVEQQPQFQQPVYSDFGAQQFEQKAPVQLGGAGFQHQQPNEAQWMAGQQMNGGGNQVRPGSVGAKGRTDSTPHVPGEYPRGGYQPRTGDY